MKHVKLRNTMNLVVNPLLHTCDHTSPSISRDTRTFVVASGSLLVIPDWHSITTIGKFRHPDGYKLVRVNRPIKIKLRKWSEMLWERSRSIEILAIPDSTTELYELWTFNAPRFRKILQQSSIIATLDASSVSPGGQISIHRLVHSVFYLQMCDRRNEAEEIIPLIIDMTGGY